MRLSLLLGLVLATSLETVSSSRVIHNKLVESRSSSKVPPPPPPSVNAGWAPPPVLDEGLQEQVISKEPGEDVHVAPKVVEPLWQVMYKREQNRRQAGQSIDGEPEKDAHVVPKMGEAQWKEMYETEKRLRQELQLQLHTLRHERLLSAPTASTPSVVTSPATQDLMGWLLQQRQWKDEVPEASIARVATETVAAPAADAPVRAESLAKMEVPKQAPEASNAGTRWKMEDGSNRWKMEVPEQAPEASNARVAPETAARHAAEANYEVPKQANSVMQRLAKHYAKIASELPSKP